MSICITSDSTCDLSQAQLRAHGVELFPLRILRDGEALQDGVEITPRDVFAHAAGGGSLCTTAALNPADYAGRFAELSAQHEAVIHINISAEFSSCHQNAVLAAADLPNDYVVDSRNLSTGHGLVVLAACQMAESGQYGPAEIVARLESMIPRVSASFVLDQLEYMRRGGRCSSVVALGANLLQLKPCIEVADGKMHVGKKYRGSLLRCVSAYIRDRLARPEQLEPDRIFITHTVDYDPDVLAEVHRLVEGLGYFREVCDTEAGCTVSCHCGPGTLGILYVRKP